MVTKLFFSLVHLPFRNKFRTGGKGQQLYLCEYRTYRYQNDSLVVRRRFILNLVNKNKKGDQMYFINNFQLIELTFIMSIGPGYTLILIV